MYYNIMYTIPDINKFCFLSKDTTGLKKASLVASKSRMK